MIQAPGGPNEDGDYPHGGWAVPHSDPAVREAIDAGHGEAFDLLLGRRTYDIWSDYWPKAENSPMADSLNEATKYVATHRPDSLGWGPVEDLGPDIVEGVRRADDWPPVSRSLPQRDCTRYRPASPSRHWRRGTMARGKSNREDGDPQVGVPEAMARRRRPLSEARGPLMSDECQLWVRS